MTGDSPVDHSEIRRFLHRHYGVRATELALLGGGLDMAARTYRVAVHSGPDLVLRCKRGDPRPAAYLVPRHLHDAGATAVAAPMRTRTRQPFLRWHGLVWSLYPFVVGDDGWTHGMTEQHWHSLGSALRTVHDTAADQALRAVVPSDGFDVARYDVLAEWDAVIRRSVSADGPAGAFARTWKRHDETIMAMRGQMRLLAQCLRNRLRDDVLCHADLHPGNVLIEEDCVHIIDWDDVLLAPRERDFIFVPHEPPRGRRSRAERIANSPHIAVDGVPPRLRGALHGDRLVGAHLLPVRTSHPGCHRVCRRRLRTNRARRRRRSGGWALATEDLRDRRRG